MTKSGLERVATATYWLLGILVAAMVGGVAVVWFTLHGAEVRGQEDAEDYAAHLLGRVRENLAAALVDGELSGSEIADTAPYGELGILRKQRSPNRVGITVRVQATGGGYPFAFGHVDRCVLLVARLTKGAEVTQRVVECPPLIPATSPAAGSVSPPTSS